jgi:uncharacterized protein (DUF1501 family)
MTTNDQRRRFLRLGLLSAATGLPVSFLRAPLSYAYEVGCPGVRKPQFLIFATSSAGDPLNCNAPGTYEDPGIAHPSDPSMAAAPLRLGDRDFRAARVWSDLPEWVRARTSFFHHATLTNNHVDAGKALALMGAVNRGEQLPSLFGKALSGCLRTLQVEPISIGPSVYLSFAGRPLPITRPTSLKNMMTGVAPARVLAARDKALDEINAALKAHGTMAQRKLLDELALGRQQARQIPEDVLGTVEGVKGDDTADQIRAAIALVKMRASSVIGLRILFGGDNHSDAGLAQDETPGYVSGVKHVALVMEELRAAGLQDQVTFTLSNVFGRTLRKGGNGRDHWGNHNVSLIIGPHVRPGVVGGLRPANKEFDATPIDSTTGAAGGDIPFAETSGAFGKTLGAAIGVTDAHLDREILRGKIVKGALVG